MFSLPLSWLSLSPLLYPCLHLSLPLPLLYLSVSLSISIPVCLSISLFPFPSHCPSLFSAKTLFQDSGARLMFTSRRRFSFLSSACRLTLIGDRNPLEVLGPWAVSIGAQHLNQINTAPWVKKQPQESSETLANLAQGFPGGYWWKRQLGVTRLFPELNYYYFFYIAYQNHYWWKIMYTSRRKINYFGEHELK